MNIEDIIGAIRHARAHIADHAQIEAQDDRLSQEDIFASVYQRQALEDYPNDSPLPSCLIYGNTYGQYPIHSVRAYDQEVGRAILITVYRPDPGSRMKQNR